MTGKGGALPLDRSALVLNQNYEPLNVCGVRRAFVLVDHGKAELLETAAEAIRGVDRSFAMPSVIRLHQLIRRPRPTVRLTRREVFTRDRHRCQYCGRHTPNLTIDHVKPRTHGGRHEWENIVTACQQCNHRKGGRTPREARMKLRSHPTRPNANVATLFGHYLDHYREWQPFLAGWITHRPDSTAAL